MSIANVDTVVKESEKTALRRNTLPTICHFTQITWRHDGCEMCANPIDLPVGLSFDVAYMLQAVR